MLRAAEAGPCYGLLMRLLLWAMRGVREPAQIEVWLDVEESAPPTLPDLPPLTVAA